MKLFQHDFIIREPLLVSILVLITIVFSALTHAYSQAYDRRRVALGVEWFVRGNQELQSNHPVVAVEDFRTALLYDPRNWTYSMHLADALMQSGHDSQAINYYLGLWQNTPSNGPVNLQLARLYAKKGDTMAAERYFNGAIFGDWPDNSAGNRRTATFELINFYLDRGDSGHAESELIILSDNLPEDPQLRTRVAALYSKVGDDLRALNQYRQALQLDPKYLPALLGASESSFRIGDFPAAQGYLSRAVHVDESNKRAKNLLTVVQSAMALNPYERGLSESDKIKRTLLAFAIASKRLQSCTGSTAASSSAVEPYLERWKQLKAAANSRFLTRHPEEIETLMDFCASAERIAQSHCSEPTPDDTALLAVARQREMEDR